VNEKYLLGFEEALQKLWTAVECGIAVGRNTYRKGANFCCKLFTHTTLVAGL
jgi:hypothetical protein